MTWMMTQRLRVGWRGSLLRREFRHWLVFPADFRRNFDELYRARFNSDFDDLYISGLVSTRGISAAGQNQDLRTLKILQLWTESWKTCFFCVQASLMLWYQFVVHTGPKANTNKTQHKQIYVVPQNRVRPRRQQIVYYWRNDTNTQLNPIQTHKTQCFTLTLGVSLKSALFHSHSCTIFFCTLALTLHSLVPLFYLLSTWEGEA
jgi:hypothetical protein